MVQEDKIFHWTVEPHGDLKLGVVIMDVPHSKVNKLNHAVMDAFEDLIHICQNTPHLDAIVFFSGKKNQFIAGADIEMLQAASTHKAVTEISQRGYALSNAWEDLSTPTLAVVDGPALGGGLELCLASTYILATKNKKTKLGLPEVLLGLIPGMGGCVRLPRRIGLLAASDLLLSGRAISASQAFKVGLVDGLLEPDNYWQSAKDWISAQVKSSSYSSKKHNMREKLLSLFPAKKIFIEVAKKRVLQMTKNHYPAPLILLKVLEGTYQGVQTKWHGSQREERLNIEQQGFLECALSDVTKNLMKVFFLQENGKKNPYDTLLKDSVWGKEILSAAVLGAGIMGSGIATIIAQQSIMVYLKDVTLDALNSGMLFISNHFSKKKKKLHWDDRTLASMINRVNPIIDWDALSECDVCIEAVVEDLQVKKQIFEKIESLVSKNCIIASNTSSLSISDMQKNFKNPTRFVGLHFFNPVPKMPLVEIIAGPHTAQGVLAKMVALVHKVGKIPLIVKDSPGFLVNRLLFPYLNEAALLIEEGISISRIDQVLVDFGMPMGPCELMDEVGIDVGHKVGKILFHAFQDRIQLSNVAQKLVDAKRLGKKAGKGLYTYPPIEKKNSSLKKIKKVYDAEVETILTWQDNNHLLSNEQILDRCLGIMIHEAARVLQENIVNSANDVDTAMIFGAGFPPFRGGLIAYADDQGLDVWVSKLNEMSKLFGKRFVPLPWLQKATHDRKRFVDLMPHLS